MANNTAQLGMIISIFKDLSVRHEMINDFIVGSPAELGADRPLLFPYLWIDYESSVVSGAIGSAAQTITYTMKIAIMDKIKKGDSNYDNILSDTHYILSTMISEMVQHQYYSDMNIKLDGDITMIPVQEFSDDNSNGWQAMFNLKVPMRFTPCNSPIEPITGYQTAYQQGITTYRLIGSQGNQGFQGIGNAGTTGVQGPQGIGSDGTTGVQGFQGNQGFQGSQARGQQGFQGSNGPKGEGFQGDIGLQGFQGNQGFQGVGNVGTQGSQGFQGVGNVGTQGNQGIMGFQGWQGFTGIQGFQGQLIYTSTYYVTEWSDFNTVGTGKLYLRVPTNFNGLNLSQLGAHIGTTGSGGTSSITLSRGRQSSPTTAPSYVDMMTTPITISYSIFDSKDSSTPSVVNTSNDDLLTGDLLRVDVLSVATASQGLTVTIQLST